MSHAMLNQLRGHPQHGAFSGGSFAIPDMQTNTAMSMFAPGTNIQLPDTPILDPFTSKLKTRREIPDTSRTVNLGEIVMFTTLSNKENFMTRVIYPIVDWGWSVRTFGWSIWNFPQHPVRPTPETAPPRFLSSAGISDSTTLMRFSIGQHMSSEYGKTTMGKANQGYNLEQMELSVQEGLNLMAIQELKRCQQKHRSLMEKLGDYTVVDLENTMKKEISQFCRPQKKERGFQTLFEEISQDMARVGGKATSAILTNRINTLILAKPEMTEYWRAGPQGPATVASPNRSFLPNGITVYYTKTYPERFNLNMGPWQSITQIGGYHKSLELDIIKDNDRDYLQNYSSKVRAVNIYNQETDAIHTIDVSVMLDECYVWNNDGTLRGADEPLSNRGRQSSVPLANSYDDYKDFLSFDPEDMGRFQPLSIEDSFQPDSDRDRTKNNNFTRFNALDGKQFPKGLQVFGQLSPEHFGWQNIRDTGGMIMYRLASLAQVDASTFNQKISAGRRLYREMCKHEPDLDFINFALKNYLRDLYRTRYPTLGAEPAGNAATAPASLKKLWVDNDPNVKTREDLYNKMATAFLQKDEWLGVGRLKGLGGGNGHIPLPIGTDLDFPEVEGRVFRNLTGFASYGGFQSMAEAYRSGSSVLRQRYNMEDLKVAADFVEIMEHISAHIRSILPHCQCFEDVLANRKTGGEVIAEQFFNMVGIPVWVNLRKTELFIMDNDTFKKTNVIVPNPTNYRGKAIDNILKQAGSGDLELLSARGEFFEELVHAGLGRFYSGGSSAQDNLLQALGNSVRKRLRQIKDDSALVTAITAARRSTHGACLAAVTNYNITTKGEITALLDQWVKPTVARAVVKNNILLGSKSVVISDAMVGIKKLIDATENVSGLALSSPFTDEVFLPLFGPLRLQMYGLIIQAMVLACNLKDHGKFMEAFLKLNSLMLPYAPASLAVGNMACVNKSVQTTGDDGTLEDTDRTALFAAESVVATARNGAYLPPGVQGLSGVTKLATIFEVMLKEIFEEPQFEEDVQSILAVLNTAKVENVAYRAAEALITDRADDLELPFLTFLGQTGSRAKVNVHGTTDSLQILAKKLLTDVRTNHVGQVLGLKLTDDVRNLGAATQSMIGGRVGQSLHSSMSMDLEEEGSPGMTSHESFVLTPLVLSADQLTRLFAKNNPEACKQLFDVRVGQPYDPSRYVPIDGQAHYLQLVQKKNQDHVRAMQGTIGRFDTDPRPHNFDWVDVPLRYVDNRNNITFIGPKFEGASNGHSKALPNVAGVRMGGNTYFTKSFIKNCQDLDEGCQNDLEKAMAICWMCTSFTQQSCQALQRKNIRIPMNFLILRPHANYLMEMCAILAPGLADLGFTAIAGKDYTYGFTTLTKEMYANLSFWAGIITLHPQNCRLIENLMCVGYGPGGGVKFFNPRDYDPLKLTSAQTPQSGSDSLMCLAIPFKQNITRSYIVTSGRLQHVDDGHGSSTSVAKAQGDDTPHFNTYQRYNLIWKWRDIRDSHIMETMGVNGKFSVYNKMCWSGFTLYHDPKSNSLKYATLNKGHWGENEGPTCQRIRQGAVELFPDFEYPKRYIIVP